ncbi:MAG: ComEA family DNA-binding protein [Acidimicrobiia bacterium]|nr:ComEA family DNA-binding protein [Actinomycetota bacterium]MBL6923801.1 ComEA family DNA-binding protein [Acidimicrobiia bacterium]MBL6925740.1 ComEA family DNA-binding protein [Acidimicrobiia bacterium]
MPDQIQPDPIRSRVQEILFERPPTTQRVLGAGALVALVVMIVLLARVGSSGSREGSIPFVTVPPTSVAEQPEVFVHVAGAVHRPGIYLMSPEARVADLIDAAGGPLGTARPDMLNLAAPLLDGSRVWVPSEDDLSDPMPLQEVEGGASTVNVNQASAPQLEQLPGVGPSLAAAIVEYRQRSGPFTVVEDLLSVPGIGPAKLAGLRDKVSL